MKRKSIFFLSLLVYSAIAVFFGIGMQTNLNANANVNALPSWEVIVHGDGGYGLLPGAEVYIQQGSTNLFDSPHYTNGSGWTYFENGGSSFPDGTYTVRAKKSGYSDGITTVVISGGSPVSPSTHVNIGPPY